MSGKTITVGVRVSPELRDELARLAKEERRSVSQLVGFMIEEGLERRRRKEREPRK